jgi:hypothetical protein
VNDIAWLPASPNGRIDQQLQLLRQRWSWSVFGWVMRHLAFPLVRAHFFVTETKESGSRMCVAALAVSDFSELGFRLFVRKPVWAALRCTFMSQNRLRSLYAPVTKAERRGEALHEAACRSLTCLACREFESVQFRMEQGTEKAAANTCCSLSCCIMQVRFKPRVSGMRPIANLSQVHKRNGYAKQVAFLQSKALRLEQAL